MVIRLGAGTFKAETIFGEVEMGVSCQRERLAVLETRFDSSPP